MKPRKWFHVDLLGYSASGQRACFGAAKVLEPDIDAAKARLIARAQPVNAAGATWSAPPVSWEFVVREMTPAQAEWQERWVCCTDHDKEWA